jgi:hypothetical protein
MSDIVESIGGALLPAFNALAEVLVQNLPAIQEFIATVSEGFGEMFAEFIDNVLPSVQAGFGAIVTFLQPLLDMLPDIAEALGQAFSFFTTGAGDIEKFRGVLTKLIGKDGAQAVIDIFTNLSGFFREAVIPMFQSFGQIVGKVMQGDFGGALKAAADHIGKFGPKLIETLAEWAKRFIEWVAPMIPPLLAELGKLLLALGNWIVTVAAPAIITKLLEWGKAFVDWVGPQILPLLTEAGKLLDKLGWWIVTEALPIIIGKLVEWGGAFLGWVVKDVLPKLPDELLKINKAVVDFLNQAASDFLTEAGKTGAALLKGFMDELAKLAPAAWTAIAGDDAGSLKSKLYSAMKDAIEHAVAGVKSWIDDLIAPFRRAWNTIKDLLDKIRGGRGEADSGGGGGGGDGPTASSIGMNGGVLRPATITIYNEIDARTQNPQLVAQAFGSTLAESMQRQLISGVR